MRPNRGGVRQFALGGLAALTLSTGAQAGPLFVTYPANTFLFQTSDAIDLGGLFSSFTVDATLGLALSSSAATTVSTFSEGLQVVQGCPFAAAACSPADWIDITGEGLSLGGTNFTQSITPTEATSFDTGSVSVTGVTVQSLRLRFFADTISPGADIGATGSLSVSLEVPSVPEPPTWALLVAIIMGIGAISARRRIG